MPKTSLAFAILIVFFLMAAGAYTAPQAVRLAPAITDSSAPVLPDVPFDYEDIVIPEYLLQSFDTSNAPFLALLDSITNAGATLGRVLFYEKGLSLNRSVSCGTCHSQSQSFGAGSAQSPGFAGALTSRNTMHINHMAFAPGSPVFWDGRIQTIHEQVLMPILHPDEMGLTTEEIIQRIESAAYYTPLFETAFGDAQVTLPRIRSALVQFVVSIAAFNSRFDQMQESGNVDVLTPIEQQGWILFQESCVQCHIEGHFGSDSMFNIGLDMVYNDPGMAGWTGNPAHHGAFKSPTLRNIAFAAPYMHDGRLATLEDVINFYSDEVAPHPNNHMAILLDQPLPFRGFRYTPEEKEALVAFMHTLSDSTILTDPKWSDPFSIVNALPQTAPAAALKMLISPNPAGKEALIQWSDSPQTGATLTLRNLEGAQVWQARHAFTPYLIPLSGLPAGVYVLEWRKGHQRQALRLVVQ